MRSGRPIIHYNNALNPSLFVVPACHPAGGRSFETTTDPQRVTCQKCLARLGRRGIA